MKMKLHITKDATSTKLNKIFPFQLCFKILVAELTEKVADPGYIYMCLMDYCFHGGSGFNICVQFHKTVCSQEVLKLHLKLLYNHF